MAQRKRPPNIDNLIVEMILCVSALLHLIIEFNVLIWHNAEQLILN